MCAEVDFNFFVRADVYMIRMFLVDRTCLQPGPGTLNTIASRNACLVTIISYALSRLFSFDYLCHALLTTYAMLLNCSILVIFFENNGSSLSKSLNRESCAQALDMQEAPLSILPTIKWRKDGRGMQKQSW